MKLPVKEAECDRLKSIEAAIELLKTKVEYTQNNCMSIIVGHDLYQDYERINRHLHRALLETEKLRKAYEHALNENINEDGVK